ncbi:helix-turn-helix domain-containing protein [Devosia sp.]|uniref:helix-turn-helix domain-containing protein n=1 Tax=Alphaproteobacteria TaxID=28211 RepID=UPI0035B25EDB
MPLIHPETLAAIRRDRDLSQKQLADRAGLGIATIKRIEGHSGPYRASRKVSNELTRTLQVGEDALGMPYVRPNEYVHRELTLGSDVDESIGFSVVEALYGITPLEQLALAPMLTALVAELSLQWRRERLSTLEDHFEGLRRDLAASDAAVTSLGTLASVLLSEKRSIDARDILGRLLTKDKACGNPLVAFLKEVTRTNGSRDLIRFDEGDGPNEVPDFWIGENIIEQLAGADGPTLFSIAMGWVRLVDFPPTVRGPANDTARLAWLEGKLTNDQYARAVRWSPANETDYERANLRCP